MNFSILFHKCDSNHYDFMLEQDEALATWQIKEEDLEKLKNGNIVKTTKIKNHEKKYLTYEGMISNNRGEVKLFDSGQYEINLWNENEIIFSLKGVKLSGEIFIKKITPDEYIFQYIPD